MPLLPPRKILFEQCVVKHADALFRVAYRLTGCRDAASELVQETYMAAWKNLDSLKDPEKLKGWMFSILRNQFHKNLRNRPIQHALLESDAILSPDSLSPNTEDDGRQKQIQTALQQLPEKQKMPLLLVTMEGMSIDDAAEILQIPRGTVLSRLHRAKQKLKSMIQRQRDPLGKSE